MERSNWAMISWLAVLHLSAATRGIKFTVRKNSKEKSHPPTISFFSNEQQSNCILDFQICRSFNQGAGGYQLLAFIPHTNTYVLSSWYYPTNWHAAMAFHMHVAKPLQSKFSFVSFDFVTQFNSQKESLTFHYISSQPPQIEEKKTQDFIYFSFLVISSQETVKSENSRKGDSNQHF